MAAEKDPVDEVKSFRTFRRNVGRWLDRYVARLIAKGERRIAERQALLSPEAARLLAAMDSNPAPVLAPNPGPELPSLRSVTPHDWTPEEHLAAVGAVIDAEYPETSEPQPKYCQADLGASACEGLAITGSNFCGDHDVGQDDEDFPIPERLLQPVEPLAPGSIITVDESAKPAKKQREARRA